MREEKGEGKGSRREGGERKDRGEGRERKGVEWDVKSDHSSGMLGTRLAVRIFITYFITERSIKY